MVVWGGSVVCVPAKRHGCAAGAGGAVVAARGKIQ